MNVTKCMGLAVILLGASGCTRVISENVTDAGVVEGRVVFPELKHATLPEGIFPNRDNLNNVTTGVSKQQLYQLLGRPHFREANGAREWDYILKLREGDEVVTCQHKVIFDKHKMAQSFYWKPSGCQPKFVSTSEKEVELVQKQDHLIYAMPNNILFYFNKSGIDYLKPEGKEQLTVFAQRILQQGIPVRINVKGYADAVGDRVYNQRLSQKRAQTVKRYLVALGLSEKSISASGDGVSEPQIECEKNMSKAEQIACLAPDRRVTITIKKEVNFDQNK